eukprot:CAMPEP_0179997724 /NCGR_PEP_ID=MMETSP0984-20121128/8290_1 /TAXON_ID=483367 /ORGANISM="non described non described, Strain CCMP 2436" /LENGTH=100 /DNA_ID=CAMNT_0021917339 /DNA_START=176 /DNA_END=475 /DNA_ORIENTATION=+
MRLGFLTFHCRPDLKAAAKAERVPQALCASDGEEKAAARIFLRLHLQVRRPRAVVRRTRRHIHRPVYFQSDIALGGTFDAHEHIEISSHVHDIVGQRTAT